MVTFSDSSLFDNWLLSPNFPLTKCRTCLTSHTNIDLRFGGIKLNTTDTNEQVLGCFPTDKPSIHSWKAGIGDLCNFFSLPYLKKKVEYFVISFTGAWRGLRFCSRHQLAHFLQAVSLLESVSFRLKFVIMWEAFSEIPSHESVFLKPSKPLVSVSSPPSIGG